MTVHILVIVLCTIPGGAIHGNDLFYSLAY